MLCRLANFSKCSLPTYVNFGLSIMKKLLDLSNENRLNIRVSQTIVVNVQTGKLMLATSFSG